MPVGASKPRVFSWLSPESLWSHRGQLMAGPARVGIRVQCAASHANRMPLRRKRCHARRSGRLGAWSRRMRRSAGDPRVLRSGTVAGGVLRNMTVGLGGARRVACDGACSFGAVFGGVRVRSKARDRHRRSAGGAHGVVPATMRTLPAALGPCTRRVRGDRLLRH
ncbi:hypothetical protein EMIT0158MI4_90344 [Burkholderia ambifaria]